MSAWLRASNHLAPRFIVSRVRFGILHHAIDLVLVQAGRTADGDFLLPARRHVLRCDIDDAVGVDVEGHLDLRHAARRRWQARRAGSGRGCGCRAPSDVRALALLVGRHRSDVVVDVQNGVPFLSPLVTGRPVVNLVHHVHREQWPVVFGPLVARLGWWVGARLAPAIYRRSTTSRCRRRPARARRARRRPGPHVTGAQRHRRRRRTRSGRVPCIPP